MGKYYKNPMDVVEGRIGRLLDDLGDSYESYKAQLGPFEDLYLVTHNGEQYLVRQIDSPGEYAFVCARREGKTQYKFYAVPYR